MAVLQALPLRAVAGGLGDGGNNLDMYCPRANSSAIYPVSSSPLLELPSTPNSPPLLNERKIHLAHDLLGAPETHFIRSRVESIAGAPSSRSSSSSARPCTETGTLPLSQVFWAFMA